MRGFGEYGVLLPVLRVGSCYLVDHGRQSSLGCCSAQASYRPFHER